MNTDAPNSALATRHRRPAELTDEKLRELSAEYTQAEIGAMFGFSRQAVNQWTKAAGIMVPTRRRPGLDHSANIPWRLRTEDHRFGLTKRLYDWSSMKLGYGDRVSPAHQRAVLRLVRRLEAAGQVIDYDPDWDPAVFENGWRFVPRDDQDAPGDIIRRPRGLPVEQLRPVRLRPNPLPGPRPTGTAHGLARLAAASAPSWAAETQTVLDQLRVRVTVEPAESGAWATLAQAAMALARPHSTTTEIPTPNGRVIVHVSVHPHTDAPTGT